MIKNGGESEIATIFHKDDLTFHMRQSPVPEFSWQTSEKLAEFVSSKHLQFDVRSLDPGKYIPAGLNEKAPTTVGAFSGHIGDCYLIYP